MTNNGYRLIHTVEDLRYYLIQGMKIEHATIPPYLTALYSLKPGTNLEAFHIIRAVVVEEMLHLTLAANVFNAVGGDINGVLTDPEFIPEYPAHLPTGSVDFKVNIEKFSPNTVETFLNIERSKEVDKDAPLVLPRPELNPWLRILGLEETYTFYSIGLFYAEVIRGLQELHQEMGDDLFCGDPNKQITPEYYYDGAGEIVPVYDFQSAIRALRVIQEQGEGSRQQTIYDAERELCHYYRFQQLELGQYYSIDKNNPLNSDSPDHPTGKTFIVDWDAVYPVKTNAKLSDYPEGSELYDAAKEFQQQYYAFLGMIQASFNGSPQALIPAVGGMFKLKESAERLIRNPIPDMEGVNAAPIYRWNKEQK
ncbi:MAG: ferritin-like protein [Xenococcaceae cyanobacterium MO_167.B27]|nr:ferritin-like protein [Xenococcaceae cyanobacterium MO_167.B27]